MLDDPTPTNYATLVARPWSATGHGQWASCGAEPELAGHLTITDHVPVDRRGTYLLFTCRAHIGLVADPRPMTTDDRAELDGRREQERRALAGRAWQRIQPISRERPST